jgi:hypothetical protein
MRRAIISSALFALVLAGWPGALAVTGTTLVRPGAPPEPMAGRWVLASGASQCGMTFGGTPEAAEGTIAPEGGCPGNFYTSRKWTFEQDALMIRDHTGAVLGRVGLAGPGRFEGKATAGQQITLAR